MQDSIFTKIIRGEIPANKIYEDDKTYAFLDIYPVQPGHTLVISKVQVDRIEDLADDDFAAMMATTKKVMKRVNEVLGPDIRPCLKTEGFDVPHAHVHVIPCKTAEDFWAKQRKQQEPNHEALGQMAERLRF